MTLTKTLKNRLLTNLSKTRSKATVDQYISVLERLQPDKVIRSLAPYRTKEMLDYIKNNYAITTQKTLYATLISLFKANGRDVDKRAVKRYTKHFEEALKEVAKVEKNRRSAKQRDAWIDWKDIISVRDMLEKRALSSDDLMEAQDWLLLSLYTGIAPRRVKDYQLMWVVDNKSQTGDKDKNYYVRSDKEFIFNNYKTKKIYGETIVDLKDCPYMLTVLDYYIDAYPDDLKAKDGFPLLLQPRTMKAIKNANWIPRRLNKLLNKKVSVSMLRHIYLTDKYGADIDIMKQRSLDAQKMGHCLSQQQDYILTE